MEWGMPPESIESFRIMNEVDLALVKRATQSQPLVSIAIQFLPGNETSSHDNLLASEVILFAREALDRCCCFCLADFDIRTWSVEECLELISPVHGIDQALQPEDEFMITIVDAKDFRTLDACASRRKSPLRLVVILFEGTALTKGGDLAMLDHVFEGVPRWMGPARLEITANFK